MRSKRYPSDISRAQFEKIQPLLEQARRKTKPRTVDLYEVFCGVLYLLRTVHSYFAKWSEPGKDEVSLLERALKKSGCLSPNKAGAQRQLHAIDRGRAEREECRHGGLEGL